MGSGAKNREVDGESSVNGLADPALLPRYGSTALSVAMVGLAELQREVKPQCLSLLGCATCSIHGDVKMELRTVLAVASRPRRLACDLSQVAGKTYHLLGRGRHNLLPSAGPEPSLKSRRRTGKAAWFECCCDKGEKEELRREVNREHSRQ